jgi:hypothetical protein
MKKLIHAFLDINNIFNEYYRGNIHFKIHYIIEGYINNIDLSNIVDYYPEELVLFDFFERFLNLNKVCDGGNLNAVIENIQSGDQFHIYSSEPIETAISCKNFNVADTLIQNGTSLKRWPGLLLKILEREYDLVCHFLYDKASLTGEAAIYTIKQGAIINDLDPLAYTVDYIKKGITPLDYAQSIQHQPVLNILLSAGGKIAEQLSAEKNDIG